jgi:hypothetical protein
MRKCMILSSIAASLLMALLNAEVGRAGHVIPPRIRFAPLQIYLDSGDRALAAYQFELKAAKGQIKIVGVEGGEHQAFREAPYYDPAALAKDRIIFAAFSTQQDLPKSRTRIATVHLQIIGDTEPEYEIRLIVSADANGRNIPAQADLVKGDRE